MFSKHLQNLHRDGFTAVDLDELPELGRLQEDLLQLSGRVCGGALNSLDSLHEKLPLSALNELRVQAIGYIREQTGFRAKLFDTVSPLLEACLGPDLAAQKNINLVISMPGDETSQIPLHCDTWTGHSPFELNLWVPLTRVQATQSMFLLPLSIWKNKNSDWDGKSGDIQMLMKKWKDDFRFIELKPGQALLFWHALPHGNVMNREKSTRWSLNVRFKNIFTPYQEKILGEYFVPWKYGVVTEMALAHGKVLQ